MGAPDLLHRLRGAGFALSLADGGGVKVAPASALTDDHRRAIRANRSELVALLAQSSSALPAATPPRFVPSRRPHQLTREQADRCHRPVWSEPEIQAFSTRVLTFMRQGINPTDADDLAERLTLRDRDGDDLRLCLECQHYRPGRCGNHRAAGLNSPEMGRDLATMLQRCRGFQPGK